MDATPVKQLAPQTTQPPASQLHQQVEAVLNLIRPAVQADGGDVELVRVTPDGLVEVRFHGACVGCPESQMTLRTTIERQIIQRVPAIKSVEALADDVAA